MDARVVILILGLALPVSADEWARLPLPIKNVHWAPPNATIEEQEGQFRLLFRSNTQQCARWDVPMPVGVTSPHMMLFVSFSLAPLARGQLVFDVWDAAREKRTTCAQPAARREGEHQLLSCSFGADSVAPRRVLDLHLCRTPTGTGGTLDDTIPATVVVRRVELAFHVQAPEVVLRQPCQDGETYLAPDGRQFHCEKPIPTPGVWQERK